MRIQNSIEFRPRALAEPLIGLSLCCAISACSSDDFGVKNSTQGALDQAVEILASEGHTAEGHTAEGHTAEGQTAEGQTMENTASAESTYRGAESLEVLTRPDTSALSGLWDAQLETADGVDEMFKLISEDGIVTTYDYQQDPVGSGDNCYNISSVRLSPNGGVSYSIGNREVTLEKQDNTLSVTFVDAEDVDRDENVDETLEQSWPFVDGVDTMDLTSCGI